MSPGRVLTTPSRLRGILGLIAAAVFALLMTAVTAPGASAGASAAASPLTTKAWHAAVAQLATPGKGCYTASYPTLAWHSVACTTAPNKRFIPASGSTRNTSGSTGVTGVTALGHSRAAAPEPETVGNGWDYSASVSGLLVGATGSFSTVSGVTSETGGGVANSYSLQLNSSFFNTPVCSGHGASCKGWEQFILSNNGSSAGSIFIQFWLLNYTGTCPTGWWAYGGVYCYTNGPATTVPSQPITSLANLSLTGNVTATSDTTILNTATTSYSVVASDSTLDLSAGWNTVEFMIGGNGGGSSANFNAGSTIVVQTITHNGTTTAPTCVLQGFTGETNNLNLVSTPAYAITSSPSIHSRQSNTLTSTASCASANGVGDTHLETFGGTYYDFQAEGTFTLAQNANMTVQNEQVSGAPNWPTAAVNAAIGTQMGSDRVAVCDSGAVYVDNAAASIDSGSSVTLASGDTISRAGSVYTVTDPQGDSVTATVNGSYIDVSVGLGQYPEAVRGLLANAPGTDDELQTASGAVLATPVSLSTLYGVYGDSWRVSPTGSIVAICNDPTKDEDPATPLWPDMLTQAQQAQGEAVCQKDGVQDKTLFESCVLDVAVLGTDAGTVYESATPPVDVAFSEDTSGGNGGTTSSPSPSTSPSISGSPTK